MMTEKSALRIEKFCQLYVVDLNSTNAAIGAGYKKCAATSQASRLLRNQKVQARIAELVKQQTDKLGVSAEWVIAELRRVAGCSAVDLFNDDGSLKPMNAWSAESRAAIVGLEFDEIFSGSGEQRVHVGTTRKVKFADKIRALELLGRYLALFRDKVEVTGLEGIVETLQEAWARTDAYMLANQEPEDPKVR
jgi:phage terminase small subunit